MRNLVITALLAAAACGSSAATRRAQALYDQGDFQGAARAADADLAGAPDDDSLHRVGLRARLAAGDAKGATDAYLAWRAGKDDDHVALRLLAETTFEQALRSPSNAIKVQAIEAIESLEIEDLADAVTRRLGDDDDQVQAAAAVAVLHSHPQAPEILASMLTSDDPVARAIAVRGMATKVGVHAADDLRNATRDPDPRVRRAAILGLAPLVDADSTDVLVTLAGKDADNDVRAAALAALAQGHRGDLRALGQQAAKDAYLGVRLAAIDVLAASNDRAGVIALMHDPDAIVAIHAARAGHTWQPTEAAAAIDRALADAAPETRAGALNLGSATLGKDGAVTRAARMTGDPEIVVRLAAARALAAGGRKDAALPILAAALSDADVDARIQAAADLARLGDARGATALAELARTADTVARRRAVASAHVTARRITPGLIASLADAAPEVRVEAARALWSLTHSAELAEEHAE